MTTIEVIFRKPAKMPVALLSKLPKPPLGPDQFECPSCHRITKSKFPDITMCERCKRLVDGGKVL